MFFGIYLFTASTPCYILTLNDNFDNWVIDYRTQPSYPNLLQTPEIATPIKPEDPKLDPDLVITYTTAREIVLNNSLLLGKPDFNGENDHVFSYLFKNPNKTITQNEIEIATKEEVQKSFHKIIENLGFKGDLKKVFFNVSKDSIRFNNPVTKKKTGMEYIRIN